MATYRKRKDAWQVQIRRSGHPDATRTFKRKSDAEAWARSVEFGIDRGDLPLDRKVLRATTLGDVLKQYREKITPRKRGALQERYRLDALIKSPLSHRHLDALTPNVFALYRDERLANVGAATVRRELAILRHALEVARKEWDVPLSANPVAMISLPRLPRARERRVMPEELTAIWEGCRRTQTPYLVQAIEMALETALRRSELVNMRWEHVDLQASTLTVPVTKNGLARTIPLTCRALAVLEEMTEKQEPRVGKVFPMSANALRLAWERLKARQGIEDLRFHDLRHEAISRFFERGLSVPEVALISGHQDYRMLARYTHLRAEDVAKKLAR